MRFGTALELARSGKAVARVGWNGKGMWITYSPGSLVDPTQLWGEANKVYAANRIGAGHSLVRILPYLTMRTSGGEILIGWLASQTDMLADDWMEVNPT